MTTGSMPYRTASFFSCPEMPLVVILSPYLFKKMKPLSWCLSFSQERASFCRALGMYIRRSLPPFEYKSKCPSLMCSTLICMSSLTRAPVAARKRITKYQNSSSTRVRQFLKYSKSAYLMTFNRKALCCTRTNGIFQLSLPMLSK